MFERLTQSLLALALGKALEEKENTVQPCFFRVDYLDPDKRARGLISGYGFCRDIRDAREKSKHKVPKGCQFKRLWMATFALALDIGTARFELILGDKAEGIDIPLDHAAQVAFKHYKESHSGSGTGPTKKQIRQESARKAREARAAKREAEKAEEARIAAIPTYQPYKIVEASEYVAPPKQEIKPYTGNGGYYDPRNWEHYE